MNVRIPFSLGTALLCLFVNAANGQDFDAVPKTPSPEYLASQNLERKLDDVAEVMPLYEVAVISRLCSDRELQLATGKSRDACVKQVYSLRQACSEFYQRKFPRADNAKVDGRLDHAGFARGFAQCLQGELLQAAESLAAD